MSYREQLKELLLENVSLATVASGGSHILGRCVFCSEGKHNTSRHLYIKLPENDDDISVYFCQICNAKGILDTNTLSNYFGIYDIDFLVNTTGRLNRIYKSEKYKNKMRDLDYYKLNNYNTPNPLSDAKIKYINNRIGVDLTYEDINKLKICLDIRELLQINNINTLTRDPRVVDELGRSFLGFISADNGFINMRNLKKPNSGMHPSLDKRYVNYNIFDKQNNSRRFYILPVNIDLNRPDPIQIHLAEGPFDILSIYLNLRKDPIHNIYSSVNGSGYIALVKHMINELKLINIIINIYIDNDMMMYKIQQISNLLEPYNIPLYIHKNNYKGEKDFGVPLNRIEENIERLL